MKRCLACDLMEGRQELPGGRIYESAHWVVEHCVGPFPLGTLILKPRRHCLHIWTLNDLEIKELGPLLRETTRVASEIVEAMEQRLPGVVDLARHLALASRVEMSLLRAVRLKLVPWVGAGGEADQEVQRAGDIDEFLQHRFALPRVGIFYAA